MTKNCHNDYKMKFSVDEEFPDLSLHNNHMAKVENPSPALSVHGHELGPVQFGPGGHPAHNNNN